MSHPAQTVDPEHSHTGVWNRHASPLSLVVLASVLGLALAGWAGGTPSPTHIGDFPEAQLRIKTPAVIRNGEFFETQIVVRTKSAIADLTLAVDPDLWRDVTVNTIVPSASEERSQAGTFRFSYGEVLAGEAFAIKIDGQVNPSRFGGSRGSIALYDGDRLVGALPLQLKVLP